MPDEAQLPYEPAVARVFNSREETRSFYNKIARIYDLMAEHSEGPMRDLGLKLLAAKSGEKVLEIGFGTGHCVVELANAVGADGLVCGVDLSDKMVEMAQELVAAAGVAERVELKQGDGQAIPYPDETFDGMFTSFTLELFDTPEIPKFLAECKRVLKPGGRCAVVAVSKMGKEGAILKAYEWTHKHFPNLVDCRPIYAKAALEAAGFAIQASEIENMWVPVEIVVGVK
ncbi:MAG: class I SAM-dependent methyltransferase [Pirellulales bacterium]|nr:class I SAM-dependent methyltransferase [Pirellulales bacterium]